MSATFIDKVSRAYDSVFGSSTPTMPSQNVQTGKFLVLYLRCSSAGTLYGCSGVTDTAGNTWVQAGTNTYTSGTTVECWYVLSSTANASNVVTMTFGGVNDYLEATCLQYTFTPTATPVDVFAVTTSGGGGTSMTSAAFTTAQANELAIVVLHGVPTFTAGSGYTERDDHNYAGVQDQSFTSVQTSVTASMTCGGSAGPIVVITFRESGGAGTPTGTATETDTALALGGMQIRGVGLATETDTALALSGSTLAGLPFNTAPYEFGQRTGLDVADFSIYASTALNVSVYAESDVLLASQLLSYTESTGADGRLTRKTHASLTAGTVYIFVAVTTGGALVAAGRITAT